MAVWLAVISFCASPCHDAFRGLETIVCLTASEIQGGLSSCRAGGLTLNTVTIVVPPSLRRYVDGQSRVPVEAATVRGALDALTVGSNALHAHLFDQANEVNRFVRVFVNGCPIRSIENDKVADGAVVTILLALAGG